MGIESSSSQGPSASQKVPLTQESVEHGLQAKLANIGINPDYF